MLQFEPSSRLSSSPLVSELSAIPWWVVLALTVAVVEALKDLFAKRAAQRLTARGTALSINLFALPVAAALAAREPFPALQLNICWVLGIAGVLHYVAITLYMFALRRSDLSVTLPMISFTPLFLLLTAPLMIGQWPSLQGVVGVLAIVVGAYLLNIGDRKEGMLAPLRALVSDLGSRAMLLVAFIWSITANVDPMGIQRSNRPWWLLMLVSELTLIFFVVCPAEDRRLVFKLPDAWIAGLCNGVSLVLYLHAITIGPLAYVLSLKRLSILVAMVLGAFLFGERRLQERLLGACVMILGVVIISTSR